MHQGIDAAGLGAAGAYLSNQAARQRIGSLPLFVAHLRALQHVLHGLGFVAAVGIGNGLA